jgi:hypothetical protein
MCNPKKLKKSIILGIAVVWASLGLGATVPLADEQPPAGEQPAAPGGEQPPSAVPSAVSMLGMAAGSLTTNPSPISLDLGPLGTTYFTGAVSGLGLWESNPFPTDQRAIASLSNGQVFVQKTDGLFQYFIQVGAYTLPALGMPYFGTEKTTGDFYGPLPVAFAKIAPTDEFSIQAGKLPTLIGAEYTFTIENMNIERGLLWNQENAVNRGVQLNYAQDPLTFALSWNDGFYSNRYTWLWGSAAYALDKENTFSLIAGGNFAHTTKSTLATPLFQNNETIFNLIYTYNAAPWAITPYFQYTHVPAASSIGAFTSAATYGGAILANYSFGDDSPLPGVSLPVRFEYIASTGNAASGAPNLLYGPGSNAWSITFTPTYQYKIFFARAEISHVGTSSTTPGLVFGRDGNNTTQTRGLLEVGILF